MILIIRDHVPNTQYWYYVTHVIYERIENDSRHTESCTKYAIF